MWLFHTHGGELGTGCISPLGFSLASIWHSCTGRESDRSMTQNSASGPQLNAEAVCPDWALGAGKREELIRFPSFEVGMQPQWRSSWSKSVSNKVTLQGKLGHLWPGGERMPTSEWAVLFLILLTASSTWSNWNQEFIGQIGLTQCFSKLICLRITGRSFWKPQIPWLLP